MCGVADLNFNYAEILVKSKHVLNKLNVVFIFA